MCNDAFPSEDELMAHQVVKHGKPITEADEWWEKMKEAQERKDRKKDQRRKRKRSREHQQPSAVTSASISSPAKRT